MFNKLLILSLILFGFSSCSGSDELAKDGETPKKKAELDALFGISDQDEAGDDELFTLLENKNKNKRNKQQAIEEVPTEDTVQAVESSPVDNSELEKLQSLISQKENEIKRLVNENDRLNQRNSELENREPEVKVVYRDNGGSSDYSGGFKEGYNNALQAFMSRSYQDAASQFEQLVAQGSSNKLADNAQYWLGETHFALKDYNQAVLDFEKVLSFPKSNKSADARFKLGLTHYRLKNYDQAKSELQAFVDQYSDNRNAARAQQILSSL